MITITFLLISLLVASLVLIIGTVLLIGVGGSIFLILFGDVLVAILIIVFVVKKMFKKSKKK